MIKNLIESKVVLLLPLWREPFLISGFDEHGMSGYIKRYTLTYIKVAVSCLSSVTRPVSRELLSSVYITMKPNKCQFCGHFSQTFLTSVARVQKVYIVHKSIYCRFSSIPQRGDQFSVTGKSDSQVTLAKAFRYTLYFFNS